jgi:hypothetical protein
MPDKTWIAGDVVTAADTNTYLTHTGAGWNTWTPSAHAQRRGQPAFLPNVPYDGRLTFVRVKYQLPDFSGGFRGSRDLPWSHDYPRGERNFTKIVSELSSTRVRIDASNILTLDDAQLGKYPIAYMAEAGFWRPNDAEVLGLRSYLTKGGFIIFDDFAGERMQVVKRFDLVAKHFDSNGEFLVLRDDLEGVATHAEFTATKVNVVALVLHSDEASNDVGSRDALPDL